MSRRGFTLLEVLVATAVMAIAVTTALSALRTSLRNAGRQVDLDRASALGRAKMNELLSNRWTPRLAPFGGAFAPAYTGGREAGWNALITPYEILSLPPRAGAPALERVQLEIWWRTDAGQQTLRLEAYRQTELSPPAVEWVAAHAAEVVGAQALAAPAGATPLGAQP